MLLKILQVLVILNGLVQPLDVSITINHVNAVGSGPLAPIRPAGPDDLARF